MVSQYSALALRAASSSLKRAPLLRPRHLNTLPRPRPQAAYLPVYHNHDHDRRHLSTQRHRNIGVLGGGLTGLATAWYITRFQPSAQVTIYEGNKRMGGWLDTETVQVEGLDGQRGTVKFERGARMVKPYDIIKFDDLAFYELVAGLNLKDELYLSPTDPDRYIYYPDHMVSLPTGDDFSLRHNSPLTILSNMIKTFMMTLNEPLFDKLYPSLASRSTESLKAWVSKALWDDSVSVGDYFAATFGGRRELVDNALSAMIHGVYGGDVWKLGLASNSLMTPRMRSRAMVLEMLKSQRVNDPGHTVSALLKQDKLLLDEISSQPETKQLLAEVKDAKAVGFKNGFDTLVNALVANLEANEKVTFLNERVTAVKMDQDGRIATETEGSTKAHDKLISTIYAGDLSRLTHNTLPSLSPTSIPAVTIRLVNLWSPHPNLNAPHNGFGYLLPQTVPFAQNPHAALGVIFDSDSRPHSSTIPYGDTLPGTKVTVMLGGHHWSDLPPDFLPTDEQAIQAGKETLQLQLGIPTEAWSVASTKLCENCIPQQLVGHTKKMKQADWELRSNFGGRLAVAGGSFTPPGVPGSLRAARDVAAQVTGWEESGRGGKNRGGEEVSVGETGLGRFGRDSKSGWVLEEKSVLADKRAGRI